MSHSETIQNPKSKIQNSKTLYPVILPVPEEVREYKPRDRVIFLSAHARKALALSAQKSGLDISLADYNKDPDGAPLPVDGIYRASLRGLREKTSGPCQINHQTSLPYFIVTGRQRRRLLKPRPSALRIY